MSLIPMSRKYRSQRPEEQGCHITKPFHLSVFLLADRLSIALQYNRCDLLHTTLGTVLFPYGHYRYLFLTKPQIVATRSLLLSRSLL